MPITLQIESKVDSLLYLEFVIVLLVLLLTIVHLFVDLSMSTHGTTILMCFLYIVGTTNPM
jgi:hypothetical protein